LRAVRPRSALIAAVLALVLPSPGAAGTVAGRVELVQKGGRRATDLSDVVVYLEGARGRLPPAQATMTMKGKAFLPRVVVVPVGGTVHFPNQDPIFHNVFSVSGENRFDLALYKRPRSGSWTFKAPGVARVYCNIHPQMSAVVLVSDSPHFTKAAADGRFALESVPAGRYILKAWNDRAGEVARTVAVSSEGVASADLLLDASNYKRVQHKRKDGSDYGPGEKY
jgi:plastocyanin